MDRYDEEFESTSKLIVALRIRPMSKKELLKEATVIATPIDNKTVAVIDPFDDAFDDVLRRSRKREWRYNFDIVFPDTALQIEVYEKTTKPQIDWVLNGFNASVFAYGATGAGKTHTMLGTESNPGVMALALIDLFDRIDNRNIVRPSNQSVKSGKTKLNGVYDVSMSYLEIYNENIRDLLSSKPGYLDLREDSKGGITVTGITRINARSADEILTQLRLGNKIRTQEATGANEVSSRSHAVLQILVKHKFVNENGISCANVGKLSMIDLAGSERAAETNNKGIRMKEGANINRSLLALSNCINALVDNKKGKFINFRDSKLTRLLKDSLIGNCRTVMIANIGPSSHHFDETQNTLKYASRARYIETKPTENLTMKNDPYNAALINLRSEVHNLKEKLEDEYEEVIAPSKQKLGHMRHQSDNVNTKSKKRNETHSRKPTNNDDGGGSSMLRRSLASTPFTEIVSKSTTNAGNNSFEKVTNTLDSIFQRQLECRNELIKTDSQIAEYVILIDEKNMELENLKAQTARSNNANNIQALESNLMSQRRSLDEIVAKHRKDLLAKINFQKDMQNLDAKVRDIQRSIPHTWDRRSQQFVELRIQNHYLTMDNMDLDLSFNLSASALKQKDTEITEALSELQILQKICSVQRDIIKQYQINVPDNLFSLYRGLEDFANGKGRKISEAQVYKTQERRMKCLHERIAERSVSGSLNSLATLESRLNTTNLQAAMAESPKFIRKQRQRSRTEILARDLHADKLKIGTKSSRHRSKTVAATDYDNIQPTSYTNRRKSKYSD